MNGYRDIFEKVHFGTILGIFGSVLSKFDVFRKNECIILNVLWYSIFMQKNIETVERFKRYSHLKNWVIWLAESFRAKISRTEIYQI